MKTQLNEIKRMQQLAGLLKEEQVDDSLANQVAKVFNNLSTNAEGNEEDGTFNSKLDDELRDLGIKFGFDGGDYISKETLSHLSSDELQSLMQELAGIKQKHPWKVEITSKSGSVTTHVVPTHDSTELHKIVSKLKQSKGVKDVKILD
jgi:hypothetical protein